MMSVDLRSRDSLHKSKFFFNNDAEKEEEQDRTSNTNNNKEKSNNKNKFYSDSCSNYDCGSSLSSLLTETEPSSTSGSSSTGSDSSDQDSDCFTELTRQMAHNTLHDDDFRERWHQNSMLSWSQEKEAIMGKFDNLKTNGGSILMQNQYYNIFNDDRSSNTDYHNQNSLPATNKSTIAFQSKKALIDDQIRAIQLYKLKQQQSVSNRGKQSSGYNKQIERNKQSKFMKQKQHRTGCSGSEMKVVFLGESGSRNVSDGTGVFLPRTVGYTSDFSKKAGCSTVLVPAGVLQALKVHFDKIGVASRPDCLNFPPQLYEIMGGLQSQHRNQSKHVSAMNDSDQDMGLPQEWTY